MADERTFVLIGASLAGAKAAETLRAEGFDGRVVLVGAERELPYERPPLSKGYLKGEQERSSAFVHEPGWYDEQRVELRLSTRATGLDTSAHEVRLDDGERLRYDKLLLATGSRVLPLQVPGADADGVLYLRELADSDRLKAAAIGAGRRVVIVGGGWIGLEVAAAACASGADVTVLERANLPLARVLGDEVATVFRDLHVERGVRLLTATATREVRTEGGRAVGVITGSGEELPADAVVVGVGVRPEVALAESGGLSVDNGVVVDASLRTSDPDVYAAGDVANAERPLLGRRLRVEHWANALDGGPVAARAMLGQPAIADFLPFFFSDQYDLGMEYVGWADPREARVVVRGDASGRAFHAFWLVDGKVAAGMHANMWDEGIDAVKDLVTSGRRVDPARLGDPSVAFADL
jgi:3-phenylpropionate/trans-cinnamate dioxygenase ferredoxin reductase subunit